MGTENGKICANYGQIQILTVGKGNHVMLLFQSFFYSYYELDIFLLLTWQVQVVEFLQPGDAVGGDAVEPVPLEHEAPQGALQPGEGEGGDGVQQVVAHLQAPGAWI